MGDEPALRVSDLEAIQPGKLKDVFGKLQKKAQIDLAEGDDESEEEESDDAEEAEVEEAAPGPVSESALDLEDAILRRARDWAIEAVKAAAIVRAPRRQTAEALRNYEREVEAAAKGLFSRVVRPGDWYLVRFGNTRKGSGTFYTRKELASPTVRRTLAPLTHAEDGNPRKPEEILALKVCDPAVGSGSFLISALRHITEALFQSLYVHGRIHESGGNKFYDLGNGQTEYLPDTEDFDDRLRARLRRHVVERCLYGVDFNPLAIELARMSLWIETLDPRLPFGFLDHKLKPGNALVGCWFDRFEDCRPQDIAIFVHGQALLKERAQPACRAAGVACRELSDETPVGRSGISMDSALGTFDVENVLKERMHVQSEETRFRGVRRRP